MKVKNERLYLPGDTRKEKVERRVRRYEWALGRVKKTDMVLDYGCGSGYGTAMLAEKAKFVVGFDIRRSNDWGYYERQNKSRISDYTEDYQMQKFNIVCLIDVLDHFQPDGQHTTPDSLIAYLAQPVSFYTEGAFLITAEDGEKYTEKTLLDMLYRHFRVVEIENDKDLLAVCRK